MGTCYGQGGGRILAKIAEELERALQRRARNGEAGRATGRVLAEGPGWSVHDVICTSGSSDRVFEERHSRVSLAFVAAGTFQYRSTSGATLLTPGSLLLGSAGHCFECGHDHAAGDRCIAFNFDRAYFERIAADSGAGDVVTRFAAPSIPAMRETSALGARACAAVLTNHDISWEELVLRFGVMAARLGGRRRLIRVEAPRSAVKRVTDVVREMERESRRNWDLAELARLAALSPFHFLRTFERVVGTTPHQYLRRLRLRDAAIRLAVESGRVIDAIYDSGFNDVSNFNRAFRAEFGMSPRRFRAS